MIRGHQKWEGRSTLFCPPLKVGRNLPSLLYRFHTPWLLCVAVTEGDCEHLRDHWCPQTCKSRHDPRVKLPDNVTYVCECNEEVGFQDEGNDGRFCVPDNGLCSLEPNTHRADADATQLSR